MRKTKMLATVLLTALAGPIAWAGQFGDDGPNGLLSDYSKLEPLEAVEGAYPVVRKPGPDVLRLRIAVTDLVPNKPKALW